MKFRIGSRVGHFRKKIESRRQKNKAARKMRKRNR